VGGLCPNHAADIWACDFLQLSDLWFRPLYAFFVIELGSRRVVHVGITRHPTDAVRPAAQVPDP
jgi:putative transposase